MGNINLDFLKSNLSVCLNKNIILAEINPKNSDQRAIGKFSISNRINWLKIVILKKIPDITLNKKLKL